MQRSSWTGPNGVEVVTSTGSSQPPRWALLLIDRVVARAGRSYMGLRWTRSSRGGSGRCYGPSSIVIHFDPGDDERTRYIVLHELAHALNRRREPPHGDGFYDALVRVALDEGALRLVQREHVQTHSRAPLTRAVARERSRRDA